MNLLMFRPCNYVAMPSRITGKFSLSGFAIKIALIKDKQFFASIMVFISSLPADSFNRYSIKVIPSNCIVSISQATNARNR